MFLISKRFLLAIGAVFFSGLFAQPAFSEPKNTAYDYQRYITFKNDLPVPIYPIVQVPADLCDGASNTGVRRILINSQANQGLLPGELMTVLIPNEKKTVINKKGEKEVRNCWYAAGRIYIFAVDVHQFEQAAIKLDPNSADMATKYDDPLHPKQMVTCYQGKRTEKGAAGNCYTGVAKNSFRPDAPAQLAEYTFDSDHADANKDPDTGIPKADIDISNVDDIYLPVAASVDNHGATGYMGSAMPLAEFKAHLNQFTGLSAGNLTWPIYSAYLSHNWGNNVFSSFIPEIFGGKKNDGILVHLPAGYNMINNTLGRPLSVLYPAQPGEQPYLISNVHYDKSSGVPSNPLMQEYINRWLLWIKGNPCANLNSLKWPDGITDKFDKANFCKKFQSNVQYVWNHFLKDDKDGFEGHGGVYSQPLLNGKNRLAFYSDCGLYDVVNTPDKQPPTDENLKNSCIIQHIVGFNSEVEEGELPGRTQALLRGVAYDPDNHGQQYQFDPFLLFAAPYDSQFNLVPFTRFVHNEKDGIGAVAYSFSIDDKYGNFRDTASGFVMDIGGKSALENQSPYDPYQQYRVSWGYNAAAANNWVKAEVCGVPLNIDGAGNHSLTMKPNQEGSYQPCDIKFIDKNNNVLAFKMFTEQKQVIDTYTGAMQKVVGFRVGKETSGDPKITSSLDERDIQNCEQNSSRTVRDLCRSANVSAVWSGDPLARDTVYMGLEFAEMPRVNFNLPPAPILDPNAVWWPDETVVKGVVNANDPTQVNFTWTPAKSAADHALLYLFTFGSGLPAQCVGGDGRGIPTTSCVVTIKAGTPIQYKLLAIDYVATPVKQAEWNGTFDPNVTPGQPAPIINDACRAGRTQRVVITFNQPNLTKAVTIYFNDGSSVVAGVPLRNGKVVVNVMGDKTMVSAAYVGETARSNAAAIIAKSSNDCTYP